MTKARELADLIANVNNGSSLAAKNLIINGNMNVAQRGDQTGLSNAYCGVDRYTFITNSSARVTGKQNGSSVENGFANALHLDVTTADASAGSSDYAYVRQYIEGQNLQHLKWGTSSAKPLTLSFYVKSPKTGTHWVEIYSYDAAKFKSASYTVNSADTWEKKTLSFSGETGTAIADDNTAGILVGWWLMAGTTYTSGTHGGDVWHTTHANRVPNQVNTMDNTSNNFYITGVQLEVGEKATAFEHEPYDVTLSKCHRYCSIISSYGAGSGTANRIYSLRYAGGTSSLTNDGSFVQLFYPQKRTETPTLSYTAVNGAVSHTYGLSSTHVGLYDSNDIDFFIHDILVTDEL